MTNPAQGKAKRPKEIRVRVLGALHSEGAKRGLSHEELRERAGCESLSKLTVEELCAQFESLTGRKFRAKYSGARGRALRQAAGMAGRKGTKERVAVMVTGEMLRMLCDTAYGMGWDREHLQRFIRRQTGADEIKTVAQFNKTWWAVKRIAKAAKAS